MQGIKFNQDGIRAILEGRKAMTRRPIKVNVVSIDSDGFVYWLASNNNYYMDNMEEFIRCFCKYKIGETVRVQSHVHKDAWVSTNITIKITNIKVERLQDISEESYEFVYESERVENVH